MLLLTSYCAENWTIGYISYAITPIAGTGYYRINAGLWRYCRNVTIQKENQRKTEFSECHKLTANKTDHGYTIRPLDNFYDFPPNDIFIPRNSLQLTRGQRLKKSKIVFPKWFQNLGPYF